MNTRPHIIIFERPLMRKLHYMDIWSTVPQKCPKLNAHTDRQCVIFRKNRTIEDWKRVIWYDGSYLCFCMIDAKCRKHRRHNKSRTGLNVCFKLKIYPLGNVDVSRTLIQAHFIIYNPLQELIKHCISMATLNILMKQYYHSPNIIV